MKLYVDMDGTIARFYETEDAVSAYRTDGTFFAKLGAYSNLITALEIIRRNGIEIIILSAVDDDIRECCINQKKAWLNEVFRGNPPKALFPPTGKSKGGYVKHECGLDEASWLLDDYSSNLNDWMTAGGHGGIKALNEVNGKGLKWSGPRIDINAEPASICKEIGQILDNNNRRTA